MKTENVPAIEMKSLVRKEGKKEYRINEEMHKLASNIIHICISILSG